MSLLSTMNTGFARILLLLILLMIPVSMSSRPSINQLTNLDDYNDNKGAKDHEGKSHEDVSKAIRRASMVQSAGSRLPDCSHACGSCMPCRLVIVGSACASLTEAESCPISYRCMCNNKTYPVP